MRNMPPSGNEQGSHPYSADSLRQDFVIKADKGSSLSFSGYIFSEASLFDEESQSLTRLRLFITDARRLVYYVVSSDGRNKSHRVYELHVEDGICHIYDGRQRLALPVEMLFTATEALCGVAPGQAASLRSNLEESLRVVSA